MRNIIFFGVGVFTLCSSYAVPERLDFREALERRVDHECTMPRDLGENLAFLISYESLKLLDELLKKINESNRQQEIISTQLNKIIDACALYTEHYKRSQISLSSRIIDTLKAYVHNARQTRIISAIEGSTKLQIGLAVVALFGLINMRLLTLHTSYRAVHNDEQKQAYKRSYQRWAGVFQKIINIEKFFTYRIRDAAIGFWGNGNFAKRFFGTVCDWCSLNTVLCIDTELFNSSTSLG